jgi:hypothetical protein
MLLLFFLLHFISYGQKAVGLKICLEYQKSLKEFSVEKEADDALNEILDVIGAAKNFYLIPCDEINNALALTYKGERYIMYDKDFIYKINKATNDWSGKFILAHELGHHINGHTRDFLIASVLDDQTKEKQREEELEADKFAGFIVAKLGASYNQIKQLMEIITSEKDDKYSTHPNRTKRLAAIKRGFDDAGVTSSQIVPKSNYLIVLEGNKDDENWDKSIEKEKEILLKGVTDPFKRMKIIENKEISDTKLTSWIYGKTLKNDVDIHFKKPKFIVVQKKYDNKMKSEIYLYDSYFVQKIISLYGKSLGPNWFSDFTDFVWDRPVITSIEFEYLFDDGTKGEFKTKSVNGYSILLKLKNNEYYNFIQKLMTQSKLFIRVTNIKKNTVYSEKINELMQTYKEHTMTEEFSLLGSSKALQLD